MAIKPTVFPRFATLDLNNGTGGAPNVVEPSSGKKDTGWNEGERPPRETFNWIHRINHDWNQYLDSIANPLQEAWTFSTTTTKADPGTNTVRFNNAVLASVTEIYFDDISNSGFDVGGWISRLVAEDRLYMQKSNDPSIFAEFRVTSVPVDETGFWTIPVAIISSGTLPAAADALSFVRNPEALLSGDKIITDNWTFSGTVDLDGATYLSAAWGIDGVITPPELTATVNDYAPTGHATASVWRLSSNAGQNISGIAGGVDGRRIHIANIGSNIFTLQDENAGSVAANRIRTSGTGLGITEQGGCELWYDIISFRWRIVSNP